MAVLSLIGITGMYLRQVTQSGVLGLLGYLVFGAGYLVLMSIQIIGVFVLPFLATARPTTSTTYSSRPSAPPTGDIGPMKLLFQISGVTFLAGGFLFGIALFRAGFSPVGLQHFSPVPPSRPSPPHCSRRSIRDCSRSPSALP